MENRKDKLELQKQYIEVKRKYDELSELYWSTDKPKPMIKELVRQAWVDLKSLNKQIYYGER